jgi:hypothetical protein
MNIPHAIEGNDKVTPLFWVKNYYDDALAIPTQPDHCRKTFVYNNDAEITAGNIVAPPSSSYVLVLTGILTTVDGTTGEIQLNWSESGDEIWRHYVDQTPKLQHTGMHIQGEKLDQVELTNTTGTDDYTIIITYYAVPV